MNSQNEELRDTLSKTTEITDCTKLSLDDETKQFKQTKQFECVYPLLFYFFVISFMLLFVFS